MFVSYCQSGLTATDRPFFRRCRQGMGLALACYVALNWVVRFKHLSGVPGEVAAGLMGAVFFALLFLWGMIVARSGDAFRRTLLLRSLAWSAVGTMFLVLVWGFVETFAGPTAFHVPLIFVPAVLICLMAAIKVVIFRRHRVKHEQI